jgi:hypothetical protein
VPTETAINPANGDIYVADGYGSQYIIQYDSKGRYIRHFGGYSSEYTDDKFDTCHGVLVDTRDKKNPTLLITDRSHTCIKRFTLDGKFLAVYHLPALSYVDQYYMATIFLQQPTEAPTNLGITQVIFR